MPTGVIYLFSNKLALLILRIKQLFRNLEKPWNKTQKVFFGYFPYNLKILVPREFKTC